MTNKQETLREAVDRVFGAAEYQPRLSGNISKPLVFVHDAIHMICGKGPFTALEEEATTIYQAVLLRSAKITRRTDYEPSSEHWPYPSLMLIKLITLPKLRGFLDDYRKHMGITLTRQPRELGEEEIRRHYDTAMRFDELFRTEYKKAFCQMSVSELECLPLQEMQKLMGQAITDVATAHSTRPHAIRTHAPQPKGLGI